MKIGDYVRFKNGKIEKIHSFAEKDNPLFNILINAQYHNTNEINKYGKPIDLIEVGDYVNGYKVSFVDEEPVLGKFVQCDYVVQYGTTNHYRFYEKDIKSIVTKEQFESMEYKVGE